MSFKKNQLIPYLVIKEAMKYNIDCGLAPSIYTYAQTKQYKKKHFNPSYEQNIQVLDNKAFEITKRYMRIYHKHLSQMKYNDSILH